jgi:hypothetical protein
MWILSIVLLMLAAFIALANIVGVFTATRNKRRGINRGYSCVPVLSAVLCTVAYAASRDRFGLIAFLPCAIDPATWTILYLPVFQLRERLSGKNPSTTKPSKS